MKLVQICLAGICLVATGCGKPDPRTSKYEQRITALESNITELYQRNENRRAQYREVYDFATNTASILNSMTESNGIVTILTTSSIEHEIKIATLERMLTNFFNSQNVKLQPRPIARTPQPTVMPASVAAQIRAGAEKAWPGDYRMQAYEIKQQTEAWYKLNQ